uniref:Histone-lysine N-methyltransferase family member SUVH9-like n=1 Tax=Tanacetum cinerariifolium TaxID=118510 RepID=A0A6L2M9B7_TANCI|nr:histone-lysine N-methyltransferase family member SUVH9-like [Tanacetum cinerariifolium]
MSSSLIDLNLYPDPIDNPNPNPNPKPIITSKIEPKSELIDDVSPNPNPNPTPIATVVPHADVADNNNVLSEYNRIQELFRTAFAAKLEQQQTYDDVTDTSAGQDPNLQAIVPVPDNQVANDNNNGMNNGMNGNMMTSSRRKSLQRSSELVRVTNLAIDDEMYFRGVVRKTRMIYDSLRVLVVMEDDKRRDKRIVRAIPGVHVGDVFFFRMELCVVGMHGQAQAGIDYLTSSQSSNGESIATSVIVSGGYEDDEDAGDVIVYTGHGGQDKHSRQVVHQKLEGGNSAMERSMHYGIEVRVIRGFKYEGSASGKVYVYDGLYKIVEAWFDVDCFFAVWFVVGNVWIFGGHTSAADAPNLYRGINVDSCVCPICSTGEDEINHILFWCDLEQQVLRRICRWWELDPSDWNTFQEWYAWFSSIRFSSKSKSLLEDTFFVAW